MEPIIAIFDALFFGPIVNGLIFAYQVLHMAGIPGALGLSILLLTVVIRLLIWPFTASQVKSAHKMASLKPFLDELKLKHKEDRKALQEAQMALYREHGVNPMGGCLPALIQLPIFIALYQAVINVFPDGGHGHLDRINSVLYNSWLHLSSTPDPNFFGLNLAAKPSGFVEGGLFLLAVPVITAALTFVQSKMTLPQVIKHKDKETKKEKQTEDMMATMQTQMVYMMPIMIGYFAFTFPVGLAIYWNTFTLMGIIQQYKITGWGGMSGLIEKAKGIREPLR